MRERNYACQCIHVCTGSRLCPTGRMSHASETDGGQLSSFVPSMGHHLIRVQSRGRDRASENHCDQLFPLCGTNGRQGFICGRGSRHTCRGLLYLHSSSVDFQQITNVYDPKFALNHIFSFQTPFPPPQSISISARSPYSPLCGAIPDLVQLLQGP